MTIFKEELDCLKYDSWVDVSKASEVPMPKGELKKWNLADSAVQRIKHIVQGQGYLPEWQKKAVLDKL